MIYSLIWAIGSATDTDSDDNDSDDAPDLVGDGTGDKDKTTATNALFDESGSKAKQSRSEKKARKVMSKLGLKQVIAFWVYYSIK